ncbi:MAG: hypothetical protein IT324_00450 [Anaerolineae bacterium]|nr:hypothetical protein [Anaerolineae bacterium]
MNAYDRIRAIVAHQEPDRIGLWDAYWEDTLINWHSQGLTESVSPTDFFDMDFALLFMDASLRLPDKLIEDTPEYSIREDKHGFVAKQWKNRSGALGYLRHSIRDENDWRQLRHRLTVDYGETARIGPESYFTPFIVYPTWDALCRQYQAMRASGKYILLHVYGPIEATWRRAGFEETLMNLIQEPAWMAEMMEAHIDLVIGTLEKARTFGIVPDGVFMVDDRGMNTGPLFSPKVHKRLISPLDRRLADYLHAQGITLFIHSDGDIRPLIPMLIDSGIDVLQPMEAKAGLDVRLLKREYGNDLCFMGNIDATIMGGDPAILEDEIRTKITAARANGGYIYHSDHSVPPTVTWDRYQWIMARVVQYGTYG